VIDSLDKDKKIWPKIFQYVREAVFGIRNLAVRATSDNMTPKGLVYMVTDACNSRCTHCDIWCQKPSGDLLTPDELAGALGDNLFKNINYIINTGGEPALRNDLTDILLAQHRMIPQARIQLSTNALLPKRVVQVLETILEHGASVDLGTSIDGIGQEHDQIRGVEGNFSKLESLFDMLAPLKDKYGTNLSVAAQFTISDANVHALPGVRAYMKKRDIGLLEG